MQENVRPLKPNRVRYFVQRYEQEYEAQAKTGEPLVATNGQRGAVRKYLCAAVPDAGLRHEIYAWLFAPMFKPTVPLTTKEFTDAQWLALKRWIGATLDESPITGEGEWAPDPDWPQEIEWVGWQAKREFHPPENIDMTQELIAQGGRVVDVQPAAEPATAPLKAVQAQPARKPVRRIDTFSFD